MPALPHPSPLPSSAALPLPQIHTLFPSPKTEEGIKGGVVLLRMRPPLGGNRPLQLAVNYADRVGKRYTCVHACVRACIALVVK